MPQKIRDSNLQSRTSRLKLPLRKRVFKVLEKGVALSYRRTSDQFGMWGVRMVTSDGRYVLESIGIADDYADANGQTVFTYGQAQEKALARFKDVQVNGGIIKPAITVAETVARYMEWFRINRKSVSETENMIRTHILPHFGDTLVNDLNTESIRKWHSRLATKAARKRSKRGEAIAHRDKPETDDARRSRKSTANRILTVLKAILNKAYTDDLAAKNDVWARVKPFENADEPIVRFLKTDEATRLMNAANPDFRKLIKAALMTGARYAELTTLTVGDYVADNQSIFIRNTKSGKSRHVPLTQEGAALFAAASAGKVWRDLIFTREDGSVWQKNYQVRPLLEACRIAKIEPAIGFHELRHTYASLLAQAGADLLTISKLLGHADTRVTSRHYAHLCDKTLANAVNRFLPVFGTETESKVTPINAKRHK
jgi:integrase